MNKEFITCLDHIINLEKTSIIQERTLQSLHNEIAKLGKSKQHKKPAKLVVNMPSVQYNNVDIEWSTELITPFCILGAVIGIIVAIIYCWNDASEEGFLGQILSFLISGALIVPIIGLPLGGIRGFIVLTFLYLIVKIIGAVIDSHREKNALEEAQQQYKKMLIMAEIQYQNEIAQYNQSLTNDADRVSGELKQQEILRIIRQQLQKKHEETQLLLAKFYNKADIYVTYRNIIAMCHIAEYMKSGICTELTGPNGAFMVFNYEMYEKKKIEQLDTIISKLDLLHFDNQILKLTLINSRKRAKKL